MSATVTGSLRFGRVKTSGSATEPTPPNLSDPAVIRDIVTDATRVARTEQRERRRRTTG